MITKYTLHKNIEEPVHVLFINPGYVDDYDIVYKTANYVALHDDTFQIKTLSRTYLLNVKTINHPICRSTMLSSNAYDLFATVLQHFVLDVN
jgi:hypothetical protein